MTKIRDCVDHVETRVRLLHYINYCDSVPLLQAYERMIPNFVASAQGFIRGNPERSAELALEVTKFLAPELRHESVEQQKILFGKHVLGLNLTEEEWLVYGHVNNVMSSLMNKNQQRPLRELEGKACEETFRKTLTENGFGYQASIPTDRLLDIVDTVTEFIQSP